MNITKTLITAGLIGSFAFSLTAQAPQDAFVDENGNLVIGDETIAPPDGEVVDGDLVIGGETIAAPDATVLDDGSLELGDGTILDVPTFPGGGEFIVEWFGDDFFDYNESVAADTNQWYFSFTFKNMYHFAASNWFSITEMQANFFFRPDSGNRSLEDGIWAYTANLFPGQTTETGSWVFIGQQIGGQNAFYDLRDSDGDGVNDLSDAEAGLQTMDGVMFITNPESYDDKGAGWFLFAQFEDGNWIRRIGDASADWVKLTDPL